MVGDRFYIWVIYDSPLDYPGFYVARKWNHDNTPTDHVIVHTCLNTVRAFVADEIASFGLSPLCFAASPQDDPKILETWF